MKIKFFIGCLIAVMGNFSFANAQSETMSSKEKLNWNAGVTYSSWKYKYSDVTNLIFGKEDAAGRMTLLGPYAGFTFNRDNGFGIDADVAFLQATDLQPDNSTSLEIKKPNFIRLSGNANWLFKDLFFVSAGLNGLYNVNEVNGGHFGLGTTLGAGLMFHRLIFKVYTETNSRLFPLFGNGAKFSGLGINLGYRFSL